MDAVAGLLDGPRARGAFLLRSQLDPPWSMRIADEAPLCLIAITRGQVWLLPKVGEALRLGPGDVAVIRGPDPYTLGDDPRTAPQVIILPENRCVTPDGQEVELMSWMGVRTWGNSPVGSAVMLSGTYELEGEVSRRLLNALPPLLVLPSDTWGSPLVGLLAEEIVKDDPGQEAVLDRLLDLLLIAVLRAWFARRFTELVGEPPMAFLTDWRLSLAADLLLEPDATIGSVAYEVGYATPYALSTAFKRVRGVSPRQHRLAAAAS